MAQTESDPDPKVRKMSITCYTRRQIKNDQPGSHDFRRFLCQFLTDFLQILRRPLSIQILTALKMS